MNKKRVILLVILILYAAMIFIFSHQSDVASQASSNVVTGALSEVVTDVSTNEYDFNFLSYIVRKIAHIIIYAGFSLILFLNIREYKKDLKLVSLLTVLGTFLYACTDEFHQTFIKGRTGQFSDVLLDTASGLIMTFMLYVIFRRFTIEKN